MMVDSKKYALKLEMFGKNSSKQIAAIMQFRELIEKSMLMSRPSHGEH